VTAPDTDAPDARRPVGDGAYHHGNLPDALRGAAADVIVEKGLGAFSLREVARRAGVSHAAPAHHFGSTRGLLTSLAVEGFTTLHRELVAAAATESDPVARLTAIGRAYVRVGIEHPAHCEVINREDVIDPDDPDLAVAGGAAYQVLEDTVRAVAEAVNPELAIDDAARLCWSAMQGLVTLSPKFRRFDELDGRSLDTEDLVARFTTLMVEGMRRAGRGP
jgi:AcrR family transcriptional regulator